MNSRLGIEFVPLTPALLVEDHAAVVRDPQMLRDWGGDDWPHDGFTAEEDLVDLVRHDREHRDGVAFTFSLLLGGVVQGCIYVHPAAGALSTRGLPEPGVDDALRHDTVVRGWLHDRPAVDLVTATFAFLDPVPFGGRRLWWQTNDRCPDQLAACDALGLAEARPMPGRDRLWWLRARPVAPGDGRVAR